MKKISALIIMVFFCSLFGLTVQAASRISSNVKNIKHSIVPLKSRFRAGVRWKDSVVHRVKAVQLNGSVGMLTVIGTKNDEDPEGLIQNGGNCSGQDEDTCTVDDVSNICFDTDDGGSYCCLGKSCPAMCVEVDGIYRWSVNAAECGGFESCVQVDSGGGGGGGAGFKQTE